MTEGATGGGGGQRESNNFFSRVSLCPKIKTPGNIYAESTFQQHKNYTNKIMKLADKEWDQSDLRLANYAENSDQMFLPK
jgi:hypothetical protein